MQMNLFIVSLCSMALLWGCSDDSGAKNGDVGPDSLSPDGLVHDVADGVDAVDGLDDVVIPGLSQTFSFGVVMGNPKPSWGDATTASLAARAGCNSLRPKLPEYHLDRWGYEIEVADMRSYAEDGLHRLIAFVTGPTREHSTMPAAEPDWKRDYYIPRNLHAPIWLAEGVVNPENYWAAYLFRTMSIYGEWVRYWEIWNEPDWVGDWRVAQAWWTRAPTAADLPRFNGSIFDYNRMLRIAWEVKEVVAPHTFIAVGGLGYDSFLDAIVRYSDHPDDGRVDADHPHRGDHYFEVVSFHHYPHLASPGHSDASARGLLEHKARFQAVLDAHDVAAKRWIVTESGAAATSLAGVTSGPAYARNYLMKVMALAHADGIDGIHWFKLSDTPNAGADPFGHMGLYPDLSDVETPEQAALSDLGVAYRTLGLFLHGARARLDTPPWEGAAQGVRGVAYQLADGRAAWLLWIEGDDAAAQVATRLTVPPDVTALRAHAWDHSRTLQSTPIDVRDGVAELSLSSSPQFFVETP